MEGDDHQPPARLQDALGGDQRAGELAQFVIHRDAQRLEGARRRMRLVRLGPHHLGHDLGKLERAHDRRLGTRLDDRLGDAARVALLAEAVDQVGELGFRQLRHQIGRGDAGTRHAHVERPVAAEREAALALVELHGGDADIEHHAVDLRRVQHARHLVEIAEAVLGDDEPAGIGEHELAARRDGARVAIDGDDAAIGGFEDGARVAPAPKVPSM